jgi:hypothetical protein
VGTTVEKLGDDVLVRVDGILRLDGDSMRATSRGGMHLSGGCIVARIVCRRHNEQRASRTINNLSGHWGRCALNLYGSYESCRAGLSTCKDAGDC